VSKMGFSSSLPSDIKTRWILRVVIVSLVILCSNVLRSTGEPRPLHLQILNGLIMSLVLNGTMMVSLTRFGIKFRYFIILPLLISGLGAAFVMSAYHVLWFPIVLLMYLWVGYKSFAETLK
jgi:hypothetical protein